jgi:hypothetical protein
MLVFLHTVLSDVPSLLFLKLNNILICFLYGDYEIPWLIW